jgi:hypothetical protein
MHKLELFGIYIHTHTHIYIYIHTYTFTPEWHRFLAMAKYPSCAAKGPATDAADAPLT